MSSYRFSYERVRVELKGALVLATLACAWRANACSSASPRWRAVLDLPRASEHGTLHHRCHLSCGPPPLPRLSLRAATAAEGKISRRAREPFANARVCPNVPICSKPCAHLTPPANLESIPPRAWRASRPFGKSCAMLTARAILHVPPSAPSFANRACRLTELINHWFK